MKTKIVNNGLSAAVVHHDGKPVTHKQITPWDIVTVFWNESESEKFLIVYAHDAERPHNWKGAASWTGLSRNGEVCKFEARQILEYQRGTVPVEMFV